MNRLTLQELVDRVRAASGQRWLLAVVAVTAMTIGAVAGELAAAGHSTRFVIIVAAAATVTTALPDSHGALIVVAAVAIRWFAAVDDVTTPWSIVVALGVLVFHALVALMAVTPPSAVVDRRLLHRWLRRGGSIAAATVAVWTLAAVVDGQRLGGNVAITFTAFAALTAAIAFVLIRTLHAPR